MKAFRISDLGFRIWGGRSPRFRQIRNPKSEIRNRALTLIEMLLALAGTAFVAVAMTMMLTAVTRGTGDATDLRSQVVRQKTVTNRVGAAVRGARMVLQSGDDYLILWVHDRRANTAPNLSEIRLIERDPTTNELASYTVEFPENWPEPAKAAADTTFQFDDDFRTITSTLKGQPTFARELWSTDATSLALAFDDADVQAAKVIGYRLGFGQGATADVAINAAALRNR